MPVRSAKINQRSGIVRCPQCGQMKLLRLPPGGKVKAYLYCRHCKREQYLDIDLSLSL